MARLHTRKHGKSKSRKPADSEVRQDANRKEVEKAIMEYSKQGLTEPR